MLNINELANALKPVVLPGEIMKVFILKEGKEYNQGVAYLDDGTMVVVDNARKMISKTIDIVVTSVLQTTAGKMIFGRYLDPGGAQGAGERDEPRRSARARAGRAAVADRRARPAAPIAAAPPTTANESADSSFHWWRTVFWLIPAIAVYTIVLGTLSLSSSLFDRTRPLRALVRAHVVVADSRDDRRRGAGARPRSSDARQDLRLRRAITRASTTFRACSASLPYQLRIIAKDSLGSFPLLGRHLKRTGHLLVDRRKPDRAGIFGWASRLTSNGLSLIVFPEGTRSRTGKLGPFKGGSLYPAVQAGLADRAAVHCGSRHVMRKGRLMTLPRRRGARRARAD